MEVYTTPNLARKHRAVGYALFIAKLGIEHCRNEFQRRGWLSALNAEAECNTPGFAQKVGW